MNDPNDVHTSCFIKENTYGLIDFSDEENGTNLSLL